MRGLLKEEADSFFESYEESRRFGLRINPLKIPEETMLPEYLKGLKKIPWSVEGRYYEESLRPGKHPFHEAGLYYIQEPSAQACAEILAPEPGEKILDLCAAPGGKSTHLAGKMNQEGLLVCNEIHPARAKILSQNVERMGIGNAVVTNMDPAGLAEFFPEFFDGIVVDAPCSGEGMFRKDEDAKNEWSPEHVKQCADRQDGILDCAARMLREGGRLVYSTCTFSPEENEQTAARFLKRHPEFSLIKPECAVFFSEGRPEWADGVEEVRKTVRIWPHRTDGEGHFMALFVKKGGYAAGDRADKKTEDGTWSDRDPRGKETGSRTKRKQDRKRPGEKTGEKTGAGKGTAPEEFYRFCADALKDTARLTRGRRFVAFGDNLYLIPEEMPELSGLKVLRPGLHVGTLKKGRMEPSHALALFLKGEEVFRTAETGTKELAEKYLRGETLTMDGMEAAKGWTLVTLEGFPLGFAKADRGVLKNHYPKGLRRF